MCLKFQISVLIFDPSHSSVTCFSQRISKSLWDVRMKEESPCSSLYSVAVTNARTKQLEHQSVSFIFEVVVYLRGKPGQDHGGGNWRGGHEEHCSLTSQTHIQLSVLYSPGLSAKGWFCPPASSYINQHSRRYPHRHAHRPIWWGLILHWGSLFPGDSRFVSAAKANYDNLPGFTPLTCGFVCGLL